MKIEKNQSYKIRFMPNFTNVTKSIEPLTMKYKDSTPTNIYFTYILNDDKIDNLKFGYVIKKSIEKCMHGYLGTSKGHVIDCHYDDNVKSYFANDDFSIITIDEFTAKNKGYTEYFDIVEYNPRNPFDIKNNLHLCFDTVDDRSFLNYTNMRWVEEGEPLWQEGDSKDSITKLYDDAIALSVIVNNYKLYLIKNAETGKYKIKFDGDDRIYGIITDDFLEDVSSIPSISSNIAETEQILITDLQINNVRDELKNHILNAITDFKSKEVPNYILTNNDVDYTLTSLISIRFKQ